MEQIDIKSESGAVLAIIFDYTFILIVDLSNLIKFAFLYMIT